MYKYFFQKNFVRLERWIHNPEVISSSLIPATINKKGLDPTGQDLFLYRSVLSHHQATDNDALLGDDGQHTDSLSLHK